MVIIVETVTHTGITIQGVNIPFAFFLASNACGKIEVSVCEPRIINIAWLQKITMVSTFYKLGFQHKKSPKFGA